MTAYENAFVYVRMWICMHGVSGGRENGSLEEPDDGVLLNVPVGHQVVHLSGQHSRQMFVLAV